MLTPVDIENKEFTKAFRGYDICEVDEFMKNLVADYEKLYRDNAELKEKNAMLNDAIGSYKGMEETMQNAILIAQKTAEDIKQNAYERSETIVKDAERRASEAINNANNAIANLEKTYLSLQRDMNGFRAKMSTLLSTYMRLLEDAPEEISGHPIKEESKPEVAVASAPVSEEKDEFSPDDTNTFTLPSMAGERTEEASLENQSSAEDQAPTETEESVPAVHTGFETERKVNPLVEELLQRNREEQRSEPVSQDVPFSVTKETVQKETPTVISSIDLKDLKNFDVFSDDSF